MHPLLTTTLPISRDRHPHLIYTLYQPTLSTHPMNLSYQYTPSTHPLNTLLQAAKAIWDFEGIYASSRHIPHVRFVGLIHPGLMGCAPSAELLNTWNERERALVSTDPDRVPPLACLPLAQGALAGRTDMNPALAEKIRNEGARTVPPREHGGNCDIKNLSKGSVIYFPVYVPGGKLSMGDIHFSQGDGEISFCGAIEMAGVLTLKTSVIKNGMELYGIRNPLYLPGPVEPR